ncbi:MAG: hypothetical protein PHF44_04280 [Candidatus Pacebacteria bacterium]|nr:hypothetical protein [Candidatus Paceibacterota bacterium]
MEKDFEVGKLIDSGNYKGPVWEWLFPEGKAAGVTIFSRKKGMEFGGHYHKGEDPSKNPEILLVVSGKMKITKKESIYAKGFILGPGEFIIIKPNVYHYAFALEDVVFVERKLQPFDPQNPDTYS